ncbi:MAG: alcohol dehydrogenase catalytic domain-containing protein [Myxococcales bacterium]|nr:alcohol dehydrogenase catalytic domain-containing protein [Myxococcales bacterium]
MRAIFFEKSIPRVLATLALKKIWKNAPFSSISPLKMAAVDAAELPGPRGVRVKNRQCGICASDLHIAFVDIDPMVHPAALPGYQRIYLGHEVVSEVEEIGTDVTGFQVGDRVLMKSRFLGATCDSQDISPRCPSCEAGHYAVCYNQSAGQGIPGVGGGWGDGYTCHESELWRLPDGIDDDSAALIEPIACGVRAVLRRPPKPGEKVMVLGCGMIGLATLQAIRAIAPQAACFAAARYPQQIKLAESYGATVLSGKDLFAQTAEHTGAKIYQGDFGNRTMLGGFDVIYDCVGTQTTLQQALRLIRAGGAVVLEGVSLHRMHADLSPVWHQEVEIIGSFAHGRENWEGESLETFDLVARWILEGKISTQGLITHRFPLEQWKQAIQTSVDKRAGSIKVMFDLQEK